MRKQRIATSLLTLCLLGLSVGQAQTRDSSLNIGPTPNYTVKGSIDYVAIGASFRTDNGTNGTGIQKTNSDGTSTYDVCTIKTGSTTTSPGAAFDRFGSEITPSSVVGNNAVADLSDRTTAQKVPAGTNIKAAYLYWTASTTSPTTADTNVQFVVGSNTYNVTADRYWTSSNNGNNPTDGNMGAVKDVTSYFTADPTSVNQTMTMNGLSISNIGQACEYKTVYGNWSLYVVYEQLGLSTRTFNLYDGLQFVGDSVTSSSVTATGFALPSISTGDKVAKVTVMGSDGDNDISGDSLTVQADNGNPSSISNSQNGINNIFNSTITYQDDSGNVTGQLQNLGTTKVAGIDLDTFNITKTIPDKAKQIKATVASNGDVVFLYSLAIMASSSTADLQITKSVEGGLTQVGVGDTYRYIIKADNRNSPAPDKAEALGVVVQDKLPAGLTYQGAEISYDNGTTWTDISDTTTPAKGTAGATTITFPTVRRLDQNGVVWGGSGTVASRLSPGDPGTAGQDLLYRVTVKATNVGALTNTASGTTASVDSNSSNDSSSVKTTVTPVADLQVTKTNNATSVNANGQTTYTITRSHNGPSASTALITDPAVTGLTKNTIACSATPGVCTTATTPTKAALEGAGFTTPSIPSGSTFQFTVLADVTATSGSVSNAVTVAPPSGTTDPTPGNNTSIDTDTLNPVPTPGSLSISKKVDTVTHSYIKVTPDATTGAIPPVNDLTYTIVVTNTSTVALTNVKVTDSLPAGLTYKSATFKTSTAANTYGGADTSLTSSTTAPDLTFAIGGLSAIEPGKSAQITVMATPDVNANSNSSAPYLNTAKATADGVSQQSSEPVQTDVIYTKLFKQVHNLGNKANITATNPSVPAVPATPPAKYPTDWSSTGDGLPKDVLEYCIDFTNYGSTALTNYKVSDKVPDNTTFLDGSIFIKTGTMKITPVSAFAGATSNYDSGTKTVNATIPSLPAGTSGSMCFRSTINY